MINTTAIIAAAGVGDRMGFDKILTELSGIPLLARTITTISAVQEIQEIIVAVSSDKIDIVKGEITFVRSIPIGKQHLLNEQERYQATLQLAICEGSDWFWWFGDYNPSGSVSDFDHLYRSKLKSLYRTLKLSPPAVLDTPLSQGGGNVENAGTMRRN